MDPPTAGATEYNFIAFGGHLWIVQELRRYNLFRACTLKKLYVYLRAAPGGVQSYVVKLRINGADSGISVTISGAGRTGADNVNTAPVSGGDYVNFSAALTAAAVPDSVSTGFVCYIKPEIKGSIVPTMMQLMRSKLIEA